MSPAPPPAPDPQAQSAVAAWRRRLLARLAAIAARADAAPDQDPLDAAIAAWRRRLAARLDTLRDAGDAPATEPVEMSPERRTGRPAPPDAEVRRGRRRSS